MTNTVQPENEDKKQAEPVEAAVVEEKVEAVEQTETAETTADDAKEAQAEEVSAESLKAKLMETEAKLAAAEKKAQDSWDALVRQKAEYENLQKRTERDIEKARKFALEKFANALLPIRDNLELGIEAANKPDTQVDAVIEGMDLTDKALIDVLNKFGIEEINPQDQKFDPEWHEAMAMQPIPNVEDNMVVIVHRKGYHLNERLLRPAQVVVAKQA
ncbi:nucleotide exchange factor GrpE [Candidatus Albibeggiatoa sp. nov. NOAA]|uniref:nucleotide exchange factor GrpE n=1 Tax=Candidatus Albibeggiatoa sp. nov. NOAA TaxID=3162724 RepID=UPI0032F1C733|nr:nucleotide exchange factor GrpE [Thiotrichaceae bacterium]